LCEGTRVRFGIPAGIRERPDELRLFEVWKGTTEEFARVQAPKAYRQAYLAKTKPMVISVNLEWNSVTGEWGR